MTPPSPLHAKHPLVIAHRGHSGYLPEASLEAYAFAYAAGADLLEQDVVMTADGILLCAHDPIAETTTNVAERFPERQRDDGHWHFADLTFNEVKSLAHLGRDHAPESNTAGFQIPSLDEVLAMIDRLNQRTDRSVGVIIEPKDPDGHRERGHEIEAELVRLLERHRFIERRLAIIQSFAIASLQMVADISDVPSVYLTETPLNASRWAQLRELVNANATGWNSGGVRGIGPNRAITEDQDGHASELLHTARDNGLAVLPWTFGNELHAMRRFFHQHRVDAAFADYPDVALIARDQHDD